MALVETAGAQVRRAEAKIANLVGLLVDEAWKRALEDP